ncbi:Potassium efflux system KefA protein / Small-conductance mechanosensitive channel [Acidisarcina polymorpha]|uniref:Potassium efflux system KefA protein / Small-conductance mechanosensitive channel n=1 Tax=Acidisarcina polymorpha TaxID=2211140 RepID=A0A2Z5G5M1_9BACT|nr:mechanosensitive ion channel family protein [Acidisarcina polymorpha]AXC14502.1 Potassium efflux system KefA protein / Small-conductance mechanosensitive channel [Acidisarcina polymorpha]
MFNFSACSLAAARAPQQTPQFFHDVFQDWLTSLQEFLQHDLPKLLSVLIFTWVLIWVVDFLTRRMVAIAESHPGRGIARASQIRTMASVLRATAIGIVGFLAALQILRDVFNFNLAPLLTSAGVAGVAIGLAAQTIVKDCLNGMLILLEDQYNVGDVVRLAGVSGTVESMSLRKTMVRDGDGTLYTIPNSQITNVANLTRDYSLPTINVAVDFSANPDEVMKVLRDAAMSVRNDPAYSDVYLADPSLLGIDSIKGSQVIYPVQFKTLANQQWAALRETERRIFIALHDHKILPGDPNRVFNGSAGSLTQTSKQLPEQPPNHPDATAAKPRETNPFTGETN